MRTLKIVACALVAGAIAITINILILDLWDAMGIVTARGGLQRLVRLWLTPAVTRSGLGEAWMALGLPGPDTGVFRTGFKVSVGSAMALLYALAIEPRLHWSAFSKGLAYAIVVWTLNAFVVLPLLGENLAGMPMLTVVGAACFAVAHTVFFVLLTLLYARLERRFIRDIA